MERLLGLLVPAGAQYLRPSELKARAARGQLPRGPLDTPERIKEYTKALRERPWAAAHADVSGREKETQLIFAQAAMRDPTMLFPDADPQVALRLSREIAEYDLVSAPRKKRLLSQKPLLGFVLRKRHELDTQVPLYRNYRYWRSVIRPGIRQEGEDALRAQFLEWYDQGGRAPGDWE